MIIHEKLPKVNIGCMDCGQLTKAFIFLYNKKEQYQKKQSMRYIFIALLLASTIALPQSSQAATSQIFDAGGGTDIERQTGLGNTSPAIAAGTAINIVLGFLGIIITVLFIYAGVLWMTANGNEENISKAKTTLTAAVIGLFIVLLSAALANLVLQEVGNASGVTVNTDSGSTSSGESIWDTIE